MSGPTPPASSRTWQRSFTTSAPAEPENTPATSCETGRASWYAMILAAIKLALNSVSPRIDYFSSLRKGLSEGMDPASKNSAEFSRI